MDALEFVLNSPHKAETFIVVIAAILSVQFLVKLFDWVVERFGLETKGMKREKKQIESIDKLEKEIDSIKEEIKDIEHYSEKSTEKRLEFESEVTSALKDIRKEMLMSKLDCLREGILDFGNACHNREYSKEAYDNVLRNWDQYEALIKELGMSNGRTEMAIEYIRKKYAEYQEKGFPQY